jgi:hypothetical protein
MSETPRSRPHDGTDMPHSVAATPPNERSKLGAERFLTESARTKEADGSELQREGGPARGAWLKTSPRAAAVRKAGSGVVRESLVGRRSWSWLWLTMQL